MGNWQDYFIENTDVLKNKLGITNEDELLKKEADMVVSKLSYLYIHGMDGNLDIEHLCQIHRFLFGDLYYFAGEFRDVDMRKITIFVPHQEINNRLEKLFSKMADFNFNENNKFEIAKYVADYYYGIIEIHPFREGNGRTAREFIRQFVLAKFPKYELDYTKINKDNFQVGVIDYRHYPLLLAYEIYNSLIEVKDIKNPIRK